MCASGGGQHGTTEFVNVGLSIKEMKGLESYLFIYFKIDFTEGKGEG